MVGGGGLRGTHWLRISVESWAMQTITSISTGLWSSKWRSEEKWHRINRFFLLLYSGLRTLALWKVILDVVWSCLVWTWRLKRVKWCQRCMVYYQLWTAGRQPLGGRWWSPSHEYFSCGIEFNQSRAVVSEVWTLFVSEHNNIYLLESQHVTHSWPSKVPPGSMLIRLPLW